MSNKTNGCFDAIATVFLLVLCSATLVFITILAYRSSYLDNGYGGASVRYKVDNGVLYCGIDESGFLPRDPKEWFEISKSKVAAKKGGQ